MQENGNDAYYAVVAKAMMQRADSDRVRVKANAVSERDTHCRTNGPTCK